MVGHSERVVVLEVPFNIVVVECGSTCCLVVSASTAAIAHAGMSLKHFMSVLHLSLCGGADVPLIYVGSAAMVDLGIDHRGDCFIPERIEPAPEAKFAQVMLSFDLRLSSLMTAVQVWSRPYEFSKACMQACAMLSTLFVRGCI